MSVQYIKSVVPNLMLSSPIIPDQDLQLFYGTDGLSVTKVIFVFHQFSLTRQIK